MAIAGGVRAMIGSGSGADAALPVPARIAAAFSLTAALLGLVVLFGWIIDSPLLKSVVPGAVSMKANTALGLLAGGLALFAVQIGDGPRLWSKSLAALTGAIGLLTLLQIVLEVDVGIDQLLFLDNATAHTSSPGRMSPVTAVCFCLVSAAIHGRDLRLGKTIYPAQWLALIVLALGYTAMLGYALDAQPLYRIKIFTSMAVHTALAFFLLGAALLLSQLSRGFTARIAAGTPQRLFFRLLPSALLGPPVIVAAVNHGVGAGYFGEGFGLALTALLVAIGFTSAIYRTVNAIAESETQRLRSDTLEQARAKLALAMSSARLGLLHWHDNKHAAPMPHGTMVLDRTSCADIGICLAGEGDETRDPTLFIHPADLPALLAARTRCLDQGAPIRLELRLRNRTDAFVYVRFTAIREHSTNTSLLCSVTDISAQRALQEQADDLTEHMRSLLASLPEIVVSFDPGTTIRQLHMPSTPAPAFTLPTDWQGRNYGDIFPPVLSAALDSAMVNTFSAEVPQTERCQLETADGVRFYRVTVSRLAGKQRALGLFLGVLSDETDVHTADNDREPRATYATLNTPSGP